MSRLILFILILNTALGCNLTDPKLNFKNSDVAAYALIKVSIDTIVNKNSEINTPNYVVDFSGLSILNPKGVNNYISEKNKLLPTTIDDSILISEKGGEVMRVKKSMLIVIHDVRDIEGGLTRVNISKMISTSNKVEMDLYLKRHSNGYRIYSCLSKYINIPNK